MFRPLPFVSMGKQQSQSAQSVPFMLAAGNKLINNNLRRIGEISKLRLPDYQSIRVVVEYPYSNASTASSESKES